MLQSERNYFKSNLILQFLIIQQIKKCQMIIRWNAFTKQSLIRTSLRTNGNLWYNLNTANEKFSLTELQLSERLFKLTQCVSPFLFHSGINLKNTRAEAQLKANPLLSLPLKISLNWLLLMDKDSRRLQDKRQAHLPWCVVCPRSKLGWNPSVLRVSQSVSSASPVQ